MRTIFLLCLLWCAHVATAQQSYYIRFPNDTLVAACSGPATDFGAPTFSNLGGAIPEVSYEDETSYVIPDACFQINRTWTIKSHPYNGGLPCLPVPNPNPESGGLDIPANRLGPVVSESGTAAPWAPSLVKLTPNDPDPTDFSTFWSSTSNCYQYTQVIKVVDSDDPFISDCPSSTLNFPDNTPNDVHLWNDPSWNIPGLAHSDLSEAPVALSIRAGDVCAGTEVTARYLLFLDLDGDGVQETVISSENAPELGQYHYNNIGTPNYGGGTVYFYDNRPIPTGQKYFFALVSTVVGNERVFSITWHGGGAVSTPQLPPGTHKIKWFVEDKCGNEKVCETTFTVGQPNTSNLHTFTGKVYHDTDNNCQIDAGETSVSGWRAKIQAIDHNGNQLYESYSTADADGAYHFQVDTGKYILTMLPPNAYWTVCAPVDSFIITTLGDSTIINFSMQPVALCPFLETDIGIWGLRRCFDNTYNVRYCNTGTVPAQDAYVRVTLDPFMSYVSSGIPGTDEGNNVWRFELGTIAPGSFGTFPLTIHLDCDSTVLGQTHCVEAHIYPDSFCLNTPGWSGANVRVQGACQSDSVHFYIKNTGISPTSVLDYIVIEDNIINRQGAFQLPAGDSMLVSVPANGSTWRLQAEQEPGSPGEPQPSATVEACGQNANGTFSIGFVSQYGESDDNPFVSVDCRQSQGSFDPNDKQGYPLGFGPDHLIEPGRPIDYVIRFQNTGTDTAFQVVVLDTLSSRLDPVRVVSGASGHPYRFELLGAGVLKFTFDNILLPDSNVNEALSHGFVKFRVAQRAGIPLGTVIPNRAAIYFDFNKPVLTNETRHQVGQNFITTAVHEWVKTQKTAAILVSPNPVSADGTLYLQHAPFSNARFELYDGQGKPVLQRRIDGRRVSLGAAGLASGMYYFKVYEQGVMFGAGKLLVR